MLRRAINLAVMSRSHGNHPFGALVADANGDILAEAENTVATEGDVTGHAEINLVRIISRKFTPSTLASATLYTSTEPCAMCAGAIYWSGISRVIFALSESALAALTGADVANPTMALPAQRVLNSGQRRIEVIGPVLVAEAIAVHNGFWKPDRTG